MNENGKATEDKRLERLYDYTKFHIGIYLSAAGGVAALIGSERANWIISKLIGFPPLLYLAFFLLLFAGMCGGMVATSITESRTFHQFWTREHRPAILPRWLLNILRKVKPKRLPDGRPQDLANTWRDRLYRWLRWIYVARGSQWVAREHGFFWASLLALTFAVIPIPWLSAKVDVTKSDAKGATETTCCWACQPRPCPPAFDE